MAILGVRYNMGDCFMINDYYNLMDVIYHRNCLDGVFSSYITFLLSRVISSNTLSLFIEQLEARAKKQMFDLHDYQGLDPVEQKQIEEIESIHQEFFHGERGVSMQAYSLFAGQYYSLKFGGKHDLLLILDTNLGSGVNIKDICQNHKFVIMIDHHTSFSAVQKEIQTLQLSNYFYFWNQQMCASQLTFSFFSHVFPFAFQKALPTNFVSDLVREIQFVGANDMKKNQTKESKCFILGIYYFKFELSHLNPLLYKRIGSLDLSYVLEKGKNLYQAHIKQICQEVSRSTECCFTSGPFKGQSCLYLEPSNAYKISDIGTVMAFLSANNQFMNLALLCISNFGEGRFSCRSHRHFGDPKALQFAQKFGGGGHNEAAGFKCSINKIKGLCKRQQARFNVNLTFEQLEKILFMNK